MPFRIHAHAHARIPMPADGVAGVSCTPTTAILTDVSVALLR
jgi:hypothetical protein